MSMYTLAAAGTYVSLDGTVLSASEWSGRFNPNLVDVTSFSETGVFSPAVGPTVNSQAQNNIWGSFSDSIPTVHDGFFEIKGFYHWSQKPHVAPYYLVAGRTMQNLVLGILNPATGTTTGGSTYTFPYWVVDEVRVMAVVRDGLRLEFTGRNRGGFNYAT